MLSVDKEASASGGLFPQTYQRCDLDLDPAGPAVLGVTPPDTLLCPPQPWRHIDAYGLISVLTPLGVESADRNGACRRGGTGDDRPVIHPHSAAVVDGKN